MPMENYGNVSDGEDNSNHSDYTLLTGSSDFSSDYENTHEDEADLDESVMTYYTCETDAKDE